MLNAQTAMGHASLDMSKNAPNVKGKDAMNAAAQGKK
jgi:hypothetical protein